MTANTPMRSYHLPGNASHLRGSVCGRIARVAAALAPDWTNPLLHVASLGWIVAFGGFCIIYGPMLLRARVNSGLGVASERAEDDFRDPRESVS